MADWAGAAIEQPARWARSARWVTGLVVALGARQAAALEPGAPFDQYAHAGRPAAGQTAGRLEVDLGTPRNVRIIDLAEPIALGERSTRYHVEIRAPGATDWTTVGSGTAIGQRNLIRLNPPQMADRAALVIEQARGALAIAELGVY